MSDRAGGRWPSITILALAASEPRRSLLRLVRRLTARLLLPPLLAGCGAAHGPTAAGPEPHVIAFVGVDLITMADAVEVAADRTVVVRAGRIAAIGPAAELRVPDEALLIDGAGQYLLPGLADMHVHLEHSTDPRILALFLANGVTTVRNMDGRPHILHWREEIERGSRVGPAIYTAGPILDGDPPLREDNTRVRDATQARTLVRAQAAAGYDFVKVYGNLPVDIYHALVEAARDTGLPVAGHVPRAVGVDAAARAGQRSIEHLTDFARIVEAEDSPFRGRFHWARLYLGVPLDSLTVERLARSMAKHEIWVVPTLIERDRGLAPPDLLRARLNEPEMRFIPARWRAAWVNQVQRLTQRMEAEDWQLLARGRENRLRLVAALHRAGAGLLIGTDTPNPFVVPGYSIHDELAAFVEAGLSPADVLALATREAARFSGGLEEWGTVEVGKRADLLLLGANPLEDIAATRTPSGVMARGRWYSGARLQELLETIR